MCHSENKYGDKQNKNRGALKLCIENTYDCKQNIKTVGAYKSLYKIQIAKL